MLGCFVRHQNNEEAIAFLDRFARLVADHAPALMHLLHA